MGKNEILVIHKVPDLDALGAITLFLEANRIKEVPPILFTDSGDIQENSLISNVIEFDRGHGKFDHHGKQASTSAEMVAKEYGLEVNEYILRFLRLVENNDVRGISQPFDLGDMIKRISHSTTNQEAAEIGIRIIRDTLRFEQMEIAGEIKRDNKFARSVIRQFMNSRKFKGPRLQKYYDLLKNPEFQRPFDFCEVLTMEKRLHGSKEARKFGLKILALVTKQERNFEKALKELEDPKVTKIYPVINHNLIVVTVISNNPEISKAARYKWPCAIVIQKNPEIGGVQIYPNQKALRQETSTVMTNLTAAVRLEEEILSGSKRLTLKPAILKSEGRLEKIPQWYYTGDRGFFLLNRSLTADDKEEIPETHISLERIAEISLTILKYGKFNFLKYLENRLRQK